MLRIWSGFRLRPVHLQQLRWLADRQDKIKYDGDFVRPRSKSRIFVAGKFLEFVKRYEKLLQRHVPAAYEVYNNLGTGTKKLYSDIQAYLTVARDLNQGKPVRKLSRRELELYYKVPNDMFHVAPTLVICTLPLTNYFIFPLLYAYPQTFLSSQFWTDRQWRYFQIEKHLRRVQYHDAVLYHLERANVSETALKQKSLEIIKKLRAGGHPTVEEILDMKSLFQDGHQLALHNLSYVHLRALGLAQGFSYGGVMPYGKLWRFGGSLWEMDRALVREGPLHALSDEEIVRCCFIRGFNPAGCDRAKAEEFLDQWLTLSLELKGRELSLLLHTPIFLTYNHPNSFGSMLTKRSISNGDLGFPSLSGTTSTVNDIKNSRELQGTLRQEPKSSSKEGTSYSRKSRIVL